MAQLYLNENAEWFDEYESESYRSPQREDLLNLAAVQTILHHGRVAEVPAAMMPTGGHTCFLQIHLDAVDFK